MVLVIFSVVSQFSGARTVALHSAQRCFRSAWLRTECPLGGESGWVVTENNIPDTFVYGFHRAGLDIFFFFFLRDYHYKVIAVTEIPFHFQKGTEINNIFQKGSGQFIPGDRSVGIGKEMSYPYFTICWLMQSANMNWATIFLIGSTEELMREYEK